jgi:hypothetical protein
MHWKMVSKLMKISKRYFSSEIEEFKKDYARLYGQG